VKAALNHLPTFTIRICRPMARPAGLSEAGYIVDHCCYAWNTLIDQPWKIMSIARRDWAAVGHSI
jgi:hypothetical protein